MKALRLQGFLVSAGLLLFGATLSAQTITVKGNVTDEAGQPVIGAGIVEQGTSRGTVSDIDGNFTLNVRAGVPLEIRCVSYKTVTVAAAQTLNIVLQTDNELLDEVVVVGYGVQRKSDITGAISKVETEALENRTVISAQDALAGKTSGIQMVGMSGAPGDAGSMRIRGYSSNYSSDPLYIVDGLKVRNLNNVDPNDIESVEVLKDAASAAIYGAEAGNGVVLVTTKRAVAGVTKVTYDFQLSASSLAHMPQIMNAQEYINYYKEKGTLSDEALKLYYDGVTDNKWYESATETGIMQRHTLSFQHASDKSSVFMSLGYLDNDGFLKGKNDGNTRYNLTLNAELKLNKWLTVGTNTRAGYSVSTYRPVAMLDGYAGGVFTNLIELDPLTPVYYDSGNLPGYISTLLEQGLPYPMSSDGRYFGGSQFISSTSTLNPLFSLEYTQYNSKNQMVNSNLYANISPLKGLVFTTRFGANFTNTYTHTYSRSYYINSYQKSDHPTVSTSSPERLYWQWENFANYSNKFGKHGINATLGMSFSETTSSTLSASVNKLSKEADNFAYINYAASDATRTVSGESLMTRKLSYFGRIGYNYADKYMVEATMRADANDLSVLSLKSRWGYFPALSAGWILSNENFFRKNGIVSYVKFRGSWGQNGSISNLGNYVYASAIESVYTYPFDGTKNYTIGSAPSTLGNDNLKWETTEQLDFGADLRFFHDKLSLTVDWYNKETKDLLISGSTPSLTAGNDPSPINAGNVTNKGWDIDLSWKDAIGDFRYGITGNIGFLKNKVSYLDPTINRLEGSNAIGQNTLTYFEVGYPIWYMRGYRVDHIDAATGDPVFKDLNKDGVWDAKDVEQIGSAIPDFTYGITFNAAWKNLDFVLFCSGSQGNDIFMNLNSVNDPGYNKLELYYTDRWTSGNTNASRPRPGCDHEKEYYLSDASVFDGSYFKVKQIQLGYTVPARICGKVGIDRIRAYVSLDDFFTFTKYVGFDPETSSVNATSAVGIDSGAYPTSKKVVFGFNVTF